MNPKNRTRWLKQYGHLYASFGFRDAQDDSDQACVYCGNVAQQADHVPPLCWIYALGSDYFASRGILLLKVPSCSECNSTLSDKKLFTLTERCRYLIGRYSKKHARFLRNHLWEEDELDELGRGLKASITGFHIFQLAIDRRIKILEENVRRP